MHRAPAPVLAVDDELVRSLARPGAFDHPAASVECIETHISWVLLAGEFVYKIKKPIELPFLDFSTLEQRKRFCDEELRLNRHWAPELYLDVVPVTVREGVAVFGGDGTVVDYAVRMRRFEQAMLLDRQLSSGDLTKEDVLALADYIAQRHDSAGVVDPADRDRVLMETRSLMEDNFVALEGRLNSDALDEARSWTQQSLNRNMDRFGQRFDDGRVRNCHGDLHLGNLVRLDEGLRAFDCIEFSADLRHIDVICDIAFLVMDLRFRGESGLAAVFFNRYLEVTGDYDGAALLELFVAYRSLVRAKVAMIRADERSSRDLQRADVDEAEQFLHLAAGAATRRRPALIMMHGLSGSGKTTVSSKLLEALHAIRVRSDLERKRLAGLGEFESSDSPPGKGLYDAASGKRTYQHLRSLAEGMLSAEQTVIVDAAFLDSAERKATMSLADRLGLPVVIVDVRAPEAVLRQRIVDRAKQRESASEADIAVLEYQQSTAIPLSEEELDAAIVCDTSRSGDVQATIDKVRLAVDP